MSVEKSTYTPVVVMAYSPAKPHVGQLVGGASSALLMSVLPPRKASARLTSHAPES